MIRFLLAFFFLPLTLFSQEALEEVKRQAYGNPFNASNENFINLSNQMGEDGKVSLVLFNDWMPLEIHGKEDNAYVTIDSANYHIMNDKVIFIKDAAYFELYPEKVEHIELNGVKFVSMSYQDDGSSTLSYFEVLEEGDYTLLRRHSMKREVRNDHPMGLAAAKEISFDRKEFLYYLPQGKSRPVEIPRKKKDFVQIFRRDRFEMVSYAKENRLSTKEVADVRSMFKYYNSLAEGS